jgi:hypothetical protein
MALVLVGFMELHMRQSPMNGTDYAEIVAMRCEHGMTLPEMAVMSRRPLEVLSRSLARDMKRASDDAPDDWSPGSVNHVDRILDERPLRVGGPSSSQLQLAFEVSLLNCRSERRQFDRGMHKAVGVRQPPRSDIFADSHPCEIPSIPV